MTCACAGDAAVSNIAVTKQTDGQKPELFMVFKNQVLPTKAAIVTLGLAAVTVHAAARLGKE